MGINDLTPANVHINSLYKNGAIFTQAYAGHATCAPSRASMMTGRFPSRFGFEFTPVPKQLSLILAESHSNAKVVPHLYSKSYFHSENLKNIPHCSKMVVPSNETMISEALQREGYKTLHFGKWHLGEADGSRPNHRGFDESLGFLKVDMGSFI